MDLHVLVRDWRVWNQICRSEGGRFGTRCSAGGFGRQRCWSEGGRCGTKCVHQKVADMVDFQVVWGVGSLASEIDGGRNSGKAGHGVVREATCGRIGKKGSPVDQAAVW